MATKEQNHSFTQELIPTYPLDNAIDWMQAHMNPEDVFSEEQLKYWATENGYVEEGDVIGA